MKFLPTTFAVRRVSYQPIATGEPNADGMVEEFGYGQCQQWMGWYWRNVSVRTLRIGSVKADYNYEWYDVDTGRLLSVREGTGAESWLGWAFERAREGNFMRKRFLQAASKTGDAE